MLVPGQTLTLQIEKPAAGGRMIARVDGQIVLVAGAIPGEHVSARITRVGKGVAYADTITVEEPSPDRVAPTTDPLCGGCLYAHIAYERQRAIKSLVIADAFGRIARVPLADAVKVASSPVEGYRMRARLHRQGRRFGFFREGTHDLCDARRTAQLLPLTTDILDRLGDDLAQLHIDNVGEVEIAENVDASERVVHLHAGPGRAPAPFEHLLLTAGVTGLTMSARPGECRVLSGSPYVTDRLEVTPGEAISVRRHVLGFFQGNRFLLRDLVAHVVAHVPSDSTVVDLYAGGGVFALAAARTRRARVTAVEGDPIAADDLFANAAAVGTVTALHQSVEEFVRSSPPGPDVAIVDPPRTGLSREALDGFVAFEPRRVIYVSCDVATLARDTRRLLDGGYHIANIEAFDLFPNTPHVETVVVFEK